MAISEKYLTYLRQFGSTGTVRELARSTSGQNLIALRHDVDHDIDVALEMACLEYREGFRSTYYLLPTASYWNDSRLVEKCFQLQEFGHEVGLHVNAIAQWFAREIDDVEAAVVAQLGVLRGGGVMVDTVSPHGDRLCYRDGFINTWCFTELREPHGAQALCGEGVPTHDPRQRIAVPRSGVLTRADGEEMPLWGVSMSEVGLLYSAVHIYWDGYFTDSGGSWTRSPDPLDVDLSRGLHQVLMHPIYWRASPRTYLFLSTARSGSKWLSQVIDTGTNAIGAHEKSLNTGHETSGEDKVTGPGWRDRIRDVAMLRRRLQADRDRLEELKSDYAESNVYLEGCLDLVLELFPEATLVHLHRDPRAVVQSVLAREWYDTPEDDRHASQSVEGWDQLDQFAKACWYARCVNERLIEAGLPRVQLEKVTGDIEELERALAGLGLAFYPHLARSAHGRIVNSNTSLDCADSTGWTQEQWDAFHQICDPVNRVLGYPTAKSSAAGEIAVAQTPAKPVRSSRAATVLRGFRFPLDAPTPHSSWKVEMEATPVGLCLRGVDGSHAHFLLGGGTWRHLSDHLGWPVDPNHYYRVSIAYSSRGVHSATVFALFYSEDGSLLSKRALGRLVPSRQLFATAFRARASAARFDLAVYLSRDARPEALTLSEASIERVEL